MKRNRNSSFWKRLVSGGASGATGEADGSKRTDLFRQSDGSPKARRLTGSDLERAYRDLLLENQVLLESNEHLHDRLARLEVQVDESPAAKELIGAQRDALVERSRRLRELEYECKNLQREQKKLLEEQSRLAASLAVAHRDFQAVQRQQGLYEREIADLRAALRAKSDELAKLTDKYYQLEARNPRVHGAAANSDF